MFEDARLLVIVHRMSGPDKRVRVPVFFHRTPDGSWRGSAHRLNLLAALFLPLTALCSVFGMDLPSGLESRPHAFWMIIGAGVLLGLLVTLMVGRRSR